MHPVSFSKALKLSCANASATGSVGVITQILQTPREESSLTRIPPLPTSTGMNQDNVHVSKLRPA